MKNLIIILIIAILPVNMFATTSGTFLSMPVSAREAALGGAFAAVNRDIDAISFNPAGLSGFDGFGLSLLYNKQLFGNHYGKVNMVHPAGFGMLGVSFAFMQIPFEETFELGAKVGAKGLNNINLGLAFQRDLIEGFSMGICARFISIDLGDKTGSTAGADIGLLYQINSKAPKNRFNIGAGVRNVGMPVKFDKQSESLPMTIIGGIMYQPIPLLAILGEVDLPKDLGVEYGGGLEFNIMDLLKPRVGYRGGNGLNNITAGMYIGKEFGSTTLGLDYAMGLEVETTHLVELKIQRPAIFEFGGDDKIPYDGESPTKIAISDLDCEANMKKNTAIFTEWLRNDFAKSKALIVIDRKNMLKILKEQELQMTGITSERDAAAIGEILNVQYLIMGSLRKVGSEYYANLKVVNVETGAVEATAEEVAGSISTIRLAAKKLVLKLDPAIPMK